MSISPGYHPHPEEKEANETYMYIRHHKKKMKIKAFFFDCLFWNCKNRGHPVHCLLHSELWKEHSECQKKFKKIHVDNAIGLKVFISLKHHTYYYMYIQPFLYLQVHFSATFAIAMYCTVLHVYTCTLKCRHTAWHSTGALPCLAMMNFI